MAFFNKLIQLELFKISTRFDHQLRSCRIKMKPVEC